MIRPTVLRKIAHAHADELPPPAEVRCYSFEELTPLPMETDEETTWSPPSTVWSWGAGVPLETVRFAAANHLCVKLGYQGSTRTIEPYSLRRTRDGHLLLHAVTCGEPLTLFITNNILKAVARITSEGEDVGVGGIIDNQRN